MAEKLVTRASVFVAVRNYAGQLLMQQRAGTGYLDGYYDFAASGHIDMGEDPLDAAVRELDEEVGLSAAREAMRLIHVNQNYHRSTPIPIMNFTFAVDDWSGEPTIREPEKCSDLRFFDTNNLPELCTLNVRLNQATGFSDQLTFTKVTNQNFDTIMRGPQA